MLQRIQSLLLAVVVITMLIALFSNVWQKENPSTKERTNVSFFAAEYSKANKVEKSYNVIYLGIVAILSVLVAAYSTFRYDDRLLQIKLGLFNSLLLSATLALNVYVIMNIGEPSFKEPIHGSYGLGFYLPIVALIANLIANRFIRKDEALVRSADRMR